MLEETAKTLEEAKTFVQPSESKRRKVNACNDNRDKTSSDTCNGDKSDNNNKRTTTANNEKKRKFKSPSFVLRNDGKDNRNQERSVPADRENHPNSLRGFAASTAAEEEERKAKELQQ